jgi:hypothetical protein
MTSSGWDVQNKAPPQNDTELMMQFLEGEIKYDSFFQESTGKKGERVVELIPTRYPEFNSKDLRTGAIDRGGVIRAAVNADLFVAQSIKYLAESTNYDLLDSYKFMLKSASRHLGLSLSEGGTLLKELRGRRLIEEGVQSVIEKNINQEEQKKKLFGLF